jgi:dimethylaniline monooxygenase (N-oxide forming)
VLSINLGASVTQIKRSEKGGHVIHYVQDGQAIQWECDALAICSGLHVTPNIPHIEGLGNVPVVLHSSDFKIKNQFGVGKDVLIVGSGETGMDLAYMAVTSETKSVTLSHRDGFHCGLKVCGSFQAQKHLLTFFSEPLTQWSLDRSLP